MTRPVAAWSRIVLLAPGLLWLVVFFVVPMYFMGQHLAL